MIKRFFMTVFACFSLLSSQANDDASKFQMGNFEFCIIDAEQKSVKVSKYIPDEASKESFVLLHNSKRYLV
ncbi:MAG: hypothetical protein HDR88_09410 [Bacteroides sp.]|nr:hypothetical protein [Bacteroides sp.]